MITKSVHDKCGDLFAAYPLAVDDGEMVLMTTEGGTEEFFILGYASGKDRYWLDPWQGEVSFDIDAETWDIPSWVADAVTHGVPLPRDGSLFGAKDGKDITAMVAVYTQCDPEHPVPSFAVMPLAGSPKNTWPPFTGEHFFGPWFWEHYRRGRIISLASLIRDAPRTVFWVPTKAPSGAGCIAVKATVRGKDGALREGVYVYHSDLRYGRIPPLGDLLAGSGKTDLAPRFKRFAS